MRPLELSTSGTPAYVQTVLPAVALCLFQRRVVIEIVRIRHGKTVKHFVRRVFQRKIAEIPVVSALVLHLAHDATLQRIDSASGRAVKDLFADIRRIDPAVIDAERLIHGLHVVVRKPERTAEFCVDRGIRVVPDRHAVGLFKFEGAAHPLFRSHRLFAFFDQHCFLLRGECRPRRPFDIFGPHPVRTENRAIRAGSVCGAILRLS